MNSYLYSIFNLTFNLRKILLCSLLGSVIVGCVYKDLHDLIQKGHDKTRYVDGLNI